MNIKKYLSFFDKIFQKPLCWASVWRAGPHAGVMVRNRADAEKGRDSETANSIPENFREAEISCVEGRAVSVVGFGLGRGMFFGFRLSCLVLAVGFVRKSGPCLYIVRKKAPAYVTGPAIFCPGVLHLHENSLHLYGPSDDFGFRSQKIGPGGCSAWFCGALFYVPYLT